MAKRKEVSAVKGGDKPKKLKLTDADIKEIALRTAQEREDKAKAEEKERNEKLARKVEIIENIENPTREDEKRYLWEKMKQLRSQGKASRQMIMATLGCSEEKVKELISEYQGRNYKAKEN